MEGRGLSASLRLLGLTLFMGLGPLSGATSAGHALHQGLAIAVIAALSSQSRIRRYFYPLILLSLATQTSACHCLRSSYLCQGDWALEEAKACFQASPNPDTFFLALNSGLSDLISVEPDPKAFLRSLTATIGFAAEVRVRGASACAWLQSALGCWAPSKAPPLRHCRLPECPTPATDAPAPPTSASSSSQQPTADASPPPTSAPSSHSSQRPTANSSSAPTSASSSNAPQREKPSQPQTRTTKQPQTPADGVKPPLRSLRQEASQPSRPLAQGLRTEAPKPSWTSSAPTAAQTTPTPDGPPTPRPKLTFKSSTSSAAPTSQATPGCTSCQWAGALSVVGVVVAGLACVTVAGITYLGARILGNIGGEQFHLNLRADQLENRDTWLEGQLEMVRGSGRLGARGASDDGAADARAARVLAQHQASEKRSNRKDEEAPAAKAPSLAPQRQPFLRTFLKAASPKPSSALRSQLASQGQEMGSLARPEPPPRPPFPPPVPASEPKGESAKLRPDRTQEEEAEAESPDRARVHRRSRSPETPLDGEAFQSPLTSPQREGEDGRRLRSPPPNDDSLIWMDSPDSMATAASLASPVALAAQAKAGFGAPPVPTLKHPLSPKDQHTRRTSGRTRKPVLPFQASFHPTSHLT